ncbi:MAG: ANTAR domain-containing protein [Actinomycetota bacterium]|nr:ANTAR domain-containing protein [Actinomycetota bacterium]
MKNPPNKGVALVNGGAGRSQLAQFEVAARVLDDLPVAVLYFLGTTMIAANMEWGTISHLDLAESAGDGWLEAIHPDDRARVAECVAEASAPPGGDLDVRVGSTDASSIWFRGHLRRTGDPTQEACLLTLTAIGAQRGNHAQLSTTPSYDRSRWLADLLRSALEGGQAIEQAAGMIAQRTGASVGESKELLRRYAMACDMPLANAARMVVDHEIDVDTVTRRCSFELCELPVAASVAHRPLHSDRGTHAP